MARRASASPGGTRVSTRPTRSGYLLMVVLLAMLTASTNYGNNMAYILTFLVLGLLMVTLMQTRRNLKGLEIKNIMPGPAYAEGEISFNLELHNTLSGVRYGVYLASPRAKKGGDLFGPFTVDPFSGTTAMLSMSVPMRGRHTLTNLVVLTVYPLGLFRAWRYCRVDKDYLVFPKPGGFMPWPSFEIHPDGKGDGFSARGGDDFVGTRPYREGESMHHIDWKAVARGGPMSIKEFSGGGSTQLWFDWFMITGLGTEGRLSQLTRWVLEADEQGREFGMKLPGQKIDLARGTGHVQDCLTALALFKYQG